MENKSSMYINIIITQAICCVIILISIFVMKCFFKTEYKDFKVWYDKNITADTDINEVIK